MRKKMKKFSAGGGAQGRYDRRMADIEKDFAKASKGKTGRAAEVAAAKRDQRIADAKDDLAKRTGGDRTQTRAAEKSAERNLSMTRKFGAMKTAVKSDDVAKVSSTDDVLKSVPKPQMAAKTPAPKAKAKAKSPSGGSSRMGDQGFAYKKKDMDKIRENAPTHRRYVRGGSHSGAAADGTAAKRLEAKGLRTGDTKGTGTSRMDAAGRGLTGSERSSARMGAALSYLNPFSYLENRATRLDPSEVNKAAGGAVKKKSTPPQPTPAERARSKRQDESLKKAKPTPADIGAMQRGNRSSGMKKGGAVKKYAAGGVTKIMPTANEMGNLGMKKGGKVKKGMMVKKAGGGKCYAKGGSVSSRADGIARKGKTNCKTC
jgi:hypothetical protein